MAVPGLSGRPILRWTCAGDFLGVPIGTGLGAVARSLCRYAEGQPGRS